MSIDTAFARLRDANPVPEPARLRDKSQDLNALLAATRQRSMEMDSELENVETQKTATPMWRKAMPGLVAAAVVILVGAAILLLARNTEPDVAGIPQNTSGEPTATYTGGACDYDGATEFELDSEVTFTFINESDDTRVGFVVWTVPDGTTAEEILEKGIFEVTGSEQGDTALYEFWEAKFPPTQLNTEYPVTVLLDRAGLYSVNCFVETGATVNTQYATIITVSG